MARVVTVPYKPRVQFLPYHNNSKRNSLTVAHRRAGKTVARINKLIQKACESKLNNPRFGYLAPYYVQAKDIAWIYLKQYTAPIIEVVGGKVNESELSITLGHNNAQIKLYGGENAERMRGLYFDGIAIDEAQGVSKTVLTTVILPCLADRQGWLDCSGTPKGWANLLGELVKLAKATPDDWFLQILKASDTDIIPKSELDRLKALMLDNEYAQEFECDFDAAITGAYYGKEMSIADEEGRIGNVEYQPEFAVHTAWDLGYSDDCAVWFFQIVNGEIHIIDFFSDNGRGVDYYAAMLDGKGYNYYKLGNKPCLWLPHDARAKTMAANGKSIQQQFDELGYTSRIVAQLSLQDGIQAARMTLATTYFNDISTVQDGIDCLKQYQREFDNDRKVYRDKPLHDWTSHAADAFRMLAVVWREEVKSKPQPDPKYKIQRSFNEIMAAQRRKREE
jgi:hypothetical protein